jgi:two-component system sensor histidine kinase EvgS
MRQRRTQEAPVGNNEAILIVEDEISTLNLSKAMLERLCYSVLATTSAHDAVQLVKESKKKISLLLTDVVMPEINGRELADRIQSLIPDIKILFMSGYTSNVIAHRGVLEEGINFIQKPFSLQQLAEGVQKALTTQ